MQSARLFVLLCTALVFAGCSPSFITHVGDNVQARAAGWRSNWDAAPYLSPMTAVLNDGSFFVIAMEDNRRFRVEKFSRDLELESSAPLVLDDREEWPTIHTGAGNTVVLTEKEELDGRRGLYSRKIDAVSGTLSDARALYWYEPCEFNQSRYSAYQSPTSAKLSIIIECTDNSARDRTRAAMSTTTTQVVSIDMLTGRSSSAHTTAPTFYDPVSGLQATWQVLDDLTAVRFGVVRQTGLGFQLLVSSFHGKNVLTGEFEIPILTNEEYPEQGGGFDSWPAQLNVSGTSNGSVFGSLLLTRAGIAVGVVTFRYDPIRNTVSFNQPISFQQIERLNDSASTSQFSVGRRMYSEIIGHNNGSRTLLLAGSSERSHWGYDGTTYLPIYVLHYSSATAIPTITRLERVEKWSSVASSLYETGLSWSIIGQTIYILTRERKEDGAVLYNVDLATGVTSSSTIVEFDDDVYLGLRYTIWQYPDTPILFLRSGETGGRCNIVRVVPEL